MPCSLNGRLTLPCIPETVQSRLVTKFTKILLHAQALQMSHLDVLKNRLAVAETALNEVDPSKDGDLYVEYNIRPFSAPSDWKFEPCLNFYDTASFSPSLYVPTLTHS